MHTLIFLIIFSSFEYVRSEGACESVGLPALPFQYESNLQYNLINKARFAYRKCMFSGDDCPPERAGVPVHDLGKSVNMWEAFDGERNTAVIFMTMEFHSEASQTEVVFKIIKHFIIILSY